MPQGAADGVGAAFVYPESRVIRISEATFPPCNCSTSIRYLLSFNRCRQSLFSLGSQFSIYNCTLDEAVSITPR